MTPSPEWDNIPFWVLPQGFVKIFHCSSNLSHDNGNQWSGVVHDHLVPNPAKTFMKTGNHFFKLAAEVKCVSWTSLELHACLRETTSVLQVMLVFRTKLYQNAQFLKMHKRLMIHGLASLYHLVKVILVINPLDTPSPHIATSKFCSLLYKHIKMIC